MARILATGVATIDLVQWVDNYPDEDDEVRALQQFLWSGGNATNTLVVLSQLGHCCSWLGTLADDELAKLIRADLERHAIDYRLCPQHAGSITPTSHITLSRSSASRTIVHYRELPELAESDGNTLDPGDYDWLHVEGRNIAVTRSFLEHARRHSPGLTVSVEIEKPRDGIESLVPYADYVLFSRQYARARGFDTAAALLEYLAPDQGKRVHVCAWGEKGAWCRTAGGELLYSPALDIEQVVDTRAAGDVFNAAFIHAILGDAEPASALQQACRLAGQKCMQFGLNDLLER